MLKFKKNEEKKSNEMRELEELRDEILKEQDPTRSKELLERFTLMVKLMVANSELNLARRQKETTIDKEVLIALIAAGTNLAGILLILNYERISIVTSKSLGFVAKLRL